MCLRLNVNLFENKCSGTHISFHTRPNDKMLEIITIGNKKKRFYNVRQEHAAALNKWRSHHISSFVNILDTDIQNDFNWWKEAG